MTKTEVKVQVPTERQLAAAFAEWDRRYREDPDAFSADWHDTVTAEEYGEAAAQYLIKLLSEQA
jgi:hypothetical protein